MAKSVEDTMNHQGDLTYDVSKEEAANASVKAIDDVPEEDFLDPKHPLYGTVDEYGRALPGWLDQITVRYARGGDRPAVS